MVTQSVRLTQHAVDAFLRGKGMLLESPVEALEVKGADGIDLLHRLSTNNVLTVKEGEIVSTIFTNEKGRIVDYVHIARLPHTLLLLVSKASASNLIKWIERYTIMEDVTVISMSGQRSTLSVIGTASFSYVKDLTGVDIKPHCAYDVTIGGIEAKALATEEFGMCTVTIVVPGDMEEALRTFFLNHTLEPISEAVYTALRTQLGIPAAGHELTADFNPYEAGLRHAISFTKGCYIGQEVIARLDTYDKVQKQMCQITFNEFTDEIEPGSPVVFNGEEIGVVTTVSDIPVDNAFFCISILKKSAFVTDDTIRVVIAGSTAGLARRFSSR